MNFIEFSTVVETAGDSTSFSFCIHPKFVVCLDYITQFFICFPLTAKAVVTGAWIRDAKRLLPPCEWLANRWNFRFDKLSKTRLHWFTIVFDLDQISGLNWSRCKFLVDWVMLEDWLAESARVEKGNRDGAKKTANFIFIFTTFFFCLF